MKIDLTDKPLLREKRKEIMRWIRAISFALGEYPEPEYYI